jgi:hypothetical protein
MNVVQRGINRWNIGDIYNILSGGVASRTRPLFVSPSVSIVLPSVIYSCFLNLMAMGGEVQACVADCRLPRICGGVLPNLYVGRHRNAKSCLGILDQMGSSRAVKRQRRANDGA